MIIHTMFGVVKPVKSFKDLLKKNGFKFIDTDMYSYITVEELSEEASCIYVDGEDFIGMPERTVMTREIVTYDHDDMEDNYKAFEQEFLGYIKGEAKDITGNVKATIDNFHHPVVQINHQVIALCGVEEAWGSFIDHSYHYDVMFLVYMGDDKFVLIPNTISMGIKLKEPCGFFLYAPIDYVPIFKLEGIGEFLKQEGVLNE